MGSLALLLTGSTCSDEMSLESHIPLGLPLPNVFYELITSWVHEINPFVKHSTLCLRPIVFASDGLELVDLLLKPWMVWLCLSQHFFLPTKTRRASGKKLCFFQSLQDSRGVSQSPSTSAGVPFLWLSCWVIKLPNHLCVAGFILTSSCAGLK